MSEMLETINGIIALRTRYGVRSVIVHPNSTWLFWSNGIRGWIIFPSQSDLKYATRVRLDANEIVVPFPSKEVRKVLDQIDELPLYGNSMEAMYNQ